MKRVPLLSPDWADLPDEMEEEEEISPIRGPTKKALLFQSDDEEEKQNESSQVYAEPWEPRKEREKALLFEGPGLMPKEDVIEEFKAAKKAEESRYGRHFNPVVAVERKRTATLLQKHITETFALSYPSPETLFVIALRVEQPNHTKTLSGQWMISRKASGRVILRNGTRGSLLDVGNAVPGNVYDLVDVHLAVPAEALHVVLCDVTVGGVFEATWKIRPIVPPTLVINDPTIGTVVVTLSQNILIGDGKTEENFVRAVVYNEK